MSKTLRHARSATLLLTLLAALPAAAQTSSTSGWPEGAQSTMVDECVTSLTNSVVAETKQQAGIDTAEPLPQDMRQALDSQFVPEFKNACGCVIGRLAENHSYQEVQANPELARTEAQRVGTPGGCPLDL